MTKFISALVVLSASVAAHAATSSSAAVVPSTVNGGTIAVPVETVAAKPSKIKINYTAETATDMAKANRGDVDQGFEAYQHIGVAYSLGNDRTIQFRQYFTYNMTDATRTDEWDMHDHVLQYTDATAYNLGSAPVLAYARVYVPGAEANREIGKYELRLVNAVEQALPNKLTFEAALGTRFYTYTETSDGQRGMRVLPAIQLSHQTTKPVALFAGTFTDHSWYHQGGRSANYRESIYTDVGLEAKLSPNMKLSVYGETGKDLKSNENYVLFDEDRTTYNLDFTVSM